jgi:hypothetical protein
MAISEPVTTLDEEVQDRIGRCVYLIELHSGQTRKTDTLSASAAFVATTASTD